MIEPEIAFADLSDNAALAEALLKYTFAALLNEREEDLAFFDQRIEKGLVTKLEGIVGSEFVHMDYGDAIEVLERSNEKFEFPVHWASTCSSIWQTLGSLGSYSHAHRQVEKLPSLEQCLVEAVDHRSAIIVGDGKVESIAGP